MILQLELYGVLRHGPTIPQPETEQVYTSEDSTVHAKSRLGKLRYHAYLKHGQESKVEEPLVQLYNMNFKLLVAHFSVVDPRINEGLRISEKISVAN